MTSRYGRFAYGETVFVTHLREVGWAQRRSGCLEKRKLSKLLRIDFKTLGFAARKLLDIQNEPSRPKYFKASV